jgi:hypothetical protein
MRRLRRNLLWAAAGVCLTAGPAPAFYFNGWPGSGEPIRRSLIQPGNQDKPGNPPGPTPTPEVPGGSPGPGPGPGTPGVPGPPGVPGTPDVPGTPGGSPPPSSVPEPATGLIGLIGLSAAVAMRWRKRRR